MILRAICRKGLLGFLLLLVLVPLLTACLGQPSGPTAVLSSDTVTGPAPLDVGFNLSLSSGSPDASLTFRLDFGDGSTPVEGADFDVIQHHIYETANTYEALLTVHDAHGQSDTDTVTITANDVGPEVGIEPGKTAPDFTGHLTTGGEISLSDYRGNVVLLEFWGSWCTPCKKSMPHLDSLVAAYADQGLVAITISTDETEKATIDFLTENGYTQFISVWEPGGKYNNPIDSLYEVHEYPTTFVIDREGIIRWVIHPLNLTADMVESLL